MRVCLHRTMAALAALSALVGLGVTGCLQTGTGPEPVALLKDSVGPHQAPGPAPNSPTGVARLFEWTYNRASLEVYRELFSDDFRFHFSVFDSAGNAYRNEPWTREDELVSTAHLFVGGHPTLPPATRIRLLFGRPFLVLPDPSHAAWDPEGRWHKVIRTQAALTVLFGHGDVFEVSGAVSFYLVRGDSALIPEDLRERGFAPDSARWYIRRWDDETMPPQGNPAHALANRDAGIARAPQPVKGETVRHGTWGQLKFMYR